MTAHTPRPWRARWLGWGHQVTADHPLHPGGRVIAALGLHEPRQRPDPEAEADARLIAAAPDLLAACKLVLGCFGPECQHPDWPTLDEALVLCRDVVARATGEDR